MKPQYDFTLSTPNPYPHWTWRENEDYEGVHELFDDAGRLLAWISTRPPYCDRGHYQANIECVPDLDAADAWPHYYMRLDAAKNEIVAFLLWRLHQVRL